MEKRNNIIKFAFLENHYLYIKLVITLMLLTALLVISCSESSNSSSEDKPKNGYAIGDTGPGGVGIVFYITDGGLHGFEVSMVDQSTEYVWHDHDDFTLGATSIDIGTGSANTIAKNCMESAALLCTRFTGGSKIDWFLPSKDELSARAGLEPVFWRRACVHAG